MKFKGLLQMQSDGLILLFYPLLVLVQWQVSSCEKSKFQRRRRRNMLRKRLKRTWSWDRSLMIKRKEEEKKRRRLRQELLRLLASLESKSGDLLLPSYGAFRL